MNYKRTISLTIVVGLLSCSSIVEPDRDETAALQTDELSYSLARQSDDGFFTTPTLQLILTNTSGGPAFLTRGERKLELVLEGLENGEWVNKHAKSIGDGGGALLLESGQSHTFEYTISGFLPGTCECQPIIAFGDGVYRFRIAAGYVDSFDEELHESGNELPLEFRTSNTFAVDAP